MKTVKVRRNDLLGALRQNLEKHRNAHKDAMKVRKDTILKELHDELLEFEENDSYYGKENYHFPIPKNNQDEYERVIKMVEMSVEEEIELDHNEFDRYVMDNWEFQHAFTRTMAAYSN